MAAILNNEGRLDWLNIMVALLGTNIKVRLFTAPTTNVKTNILSSYTAATFAGYADQSPAFAAATLDANGNGQAVAPALTFTSSGPTPANTIYGYLIYDGTSSKVWYSDLFTAPITINATGQSITVTPTMYFGDCVPPL